MNDSTHQSRLKQLIAKGKEQGYLTYSEVNDHLPEDISDPDQVEEIIQMINDMGIQVFEHAPDEDTLIMTGGDSSDDIAAAEAAAALAAVETETGRTTDPVRMYMREMGTVELLTREGEIVIAKRIEEGIRDVMAALAYYPGIVPSVLTEYDKVVAEERRLGDIMSGYLDPADNVPSPQAQAAAAAESSDDDEETSSGPDPEEARLRFTALQKQQDKVDKSIAKHGRYSKQTAKELAALGELFKFFKLTPSMFDPLIEEVRTTLSSIRALEKEFMLICVKNVGMDRKEFIRSFQGNEANAEWVDEHIEKHPALADYKPALLRIQQRIAVIEQRQDLTISDIKEINRRISIGEARARRAKKEMV